MRYPVHGLKADHAGLLIAIFALKPWPGESTTNATYHLGIVAEDNINLTNGDTVSAMIVFDQNRRSQPSSKVDYSWLLSMRSHPQFQECLAGGVLLCEEDGQTATVVGFARSIGDTETLISKSGPAGDVAAEILTFLMENTNA